jgi:hypothetical protein
MTAMASATPPAGGDGYTKADVTFDENQPVSRLWGIPIFGYLVRWLALIPHFIVLWLAGVLLGLSVVVSWLPVLIVGRQPFAGFYRWYFTYTSRIFAWAFFLAAPYPPILGGDPGYPVQVSMPTDGSINRLWGIPWLGIAVRYILLIPHLIVAFFFSIAMYVVWLILWVFILVNGRAPGFAYMIVGGLIRQQLRIGTWLLLSPLSYPPVVP